MISAEKIRKLVVQFAAEASTPGTSGQQVVRSWQEIVDRYAALAGSTESRQQAFDELGGYVLEVGFIAAVVASARLDVSITQILQTVDRCPALLDWDLEDSFIERWQKVGIDSGLRSCLGAMPVADRQRYCQQLTSELLDLPKIQTIGDATLFLLTYGWPDVEPDPKTTSTNAPLWLACAALLIRLRGGVNSMTELHYESQLGKLLSSPQLPLSPTLVESSAAPLQALVWRARRRFVSPGQDDSFDWLWPVLTAISSPDSSSKTTRLTKEFLRLASPDEDSMGRHAWFWAMLQYSKDFPNRAPEYLNRSQEALRTLTPTLQERSIWKPLLAGGADAAEKLSQARDEARGLTDRIQEFLGNQRVTDTKSLQLLIEGIRGRALDQLKKVLVQVGSAARDKVQRGPDGTLQFEVAQREQKRLQGVVDQAKADATHRPEVAKRTAKSAWRRMAGTNECTDMTRKRLDNALEGSRRELPVVVACSLLHDSPHLVTALLLEDLVQAAWLEDLSDEDREIERLVSSARKFDASNLPATLPGADPRSLGWFLSAVLDSDILAQAPRLSLELLFRDQRADDLEEQAVLTELAIGLATDWSMNRHITQLQNEGQRSQAFDLMLLLDTDQRAALDPRLREVFEKTSQSWQATKAELSRLLTWAEVFGSWLNLTVPADWHEVTSREAPQSHAKLELTSGAVTTLHRELLATARRVIADADRLAGEVERLGAQDSFQSKRFLRAWKQARPVLASKELFEEKAGEVRRKPIQELLQAEREVKIHLDTGRSPLVRALEEFLPLTATAISDGPPNEPSDDELLRCRDAVTRIETPRFSPGVRDILERCIRCYAQEQRPIFRSRLGNYAMAWCEARLEDETNIGRKIEILKDMLSCQVPLAWANECHPVQPWGQKRYLGSSAHLASSILFARLAWNLTQAAAEGRHPEDSKKAEGTDLRRLLREVEKSSHLSLQRYGELARVLHQLVRDLESGHEETETKGSTYDSLIDNLPTVQIARLVLPSVRYQPAKELSGFIWKIIITYSAFCGGYSRTVDPAAFGLLLEDPEWNDLLKETGTGSAVQSILKAAPDLVSDNAEKKRRASEAFKRSQEALLNPEINLKKRKGAASAAEWFLSQLSGVLSDFLWDKNTASQPIELEISSPWDQCFLDSERDEAWIYLNVRHTANVDAMAQNVEVPLESPRVEKARTLQSDGDILKISEYLAPHEVRGSRIFVDSEWAKDCAQASKPVRLDLSVRFTRRHGESQPMAKRSTFSVVPCKPRSEFDDEDYEDLFPGQSGGTVYGPGFHGRQKLLSRLKRMLEREKNIEIKGFRGIGKTSILYELERQLPPSEGWLFVVQEDYGTAAFGSAPAWYRNVLLDLRNKELPAGSDWRRIGDYLEGSGDSQLHNCLQSLQEETEPVAAGKLLTTIVESIAKIPLPSGETVKPVIVFDQLEKLYEMWYRLENQADNQRQISHLLALLRSWSHNPHHKKAIRWILCGPPSFFAAADRTKDLTTQPHASRGSSTINVPRLPPEDVSNWVQSAAEEHDVPLDPDLPEQLSFISGGHPWVVAIYGHYLARAAHGIHPALTCADLQAAEESLFDNSQHLLALRNRMVGDTVQPDVDSRLCYVLLISCAFETGRGGRCLPSTLRERLSSQDEIAFRDFEAKIPDAIQRLIDMGFLVSSNDILEDEGTLSLVSPFLERLFVRHPDFGQGYINEALKDFRARVPEPRSRRVPGSAFPPPGAVPHVWISRFEEVYDCLISDSPGWISRLLSLCLNCGPAAGLRNGSEMNFNYVAPSEPHEVELANLVRWASQRLEEQAPRMWQDVTPQSYSGDSQLTSLTALDHALRESDTSHAVGSIWNEVCGQLGCSWIVEHLRRQTNFAKTQLRSAPLPIKVVWKPQQDTPPLAPPVDIPKLLAQQNLLTSLKELAPEEMAVGLRIPIDRLTISRPSRQFSLSFAVVNIEWRGAETPFDGRFGWQRKLLTALSPFCHVLGRSEKLGSGNGLLLSQEVGGPRSKELGELPWRREGDFGEFYDLSCLGHAPDEYSDGLAVVFPILSEGQPVSDA